VIVSVTVISVAGNAVVGFEWPAPTHRPIFSIPDLKSKPGVPVAAVFDWVENRQDEAECRLSDFPSLACLRRR
jgi:hypothetical protein